jgi:hypothetical protein
MELLCCGVHHLDKERKPPNLDIFRPLKDLLADAQRGKAYKPIRVPAQAGAAAAEAAPQQVGACPLLPIPYAVLVLPRSSAQRANDGTCTQQG